ncbi:MAG: alpha-ketoglutarate-dependent dioxygenase AlkB [Acidobacteriia bacterium]|nr:alpha-ketoglutarate-dependent dioxygenase AlkB [Terriglobia bacterium]
MEIEIAPGFSVTYIEGFYEPREADDLFHALVGLEMTHEEVRMRGRLYRCRRKTLPVGVDYNYNPASKSASEWTPLMLDIKTRVESVAGPLDGGLVQLYPDGNAGIGWHEDKHKPEVVASLSLGAERDFVFGVGPTNKCTEVWRRRLTHGSLILVPSQTNEAFKHRLPPTKRVNQPRVNVTLRRFTRQPGTR